ncbi:MAG TPA: hypothetical protein VIP05_25210, partial [Burkholderiaceae bacterium]
MTRPAARRSGSARPAPAPAVAPAAPEPVPAGLVWVSDAEPGYRRVRRGDDGFFQRLAKRLRD